MWQVRRLASVGVAGLLGLVLAVSHAQEFMLRQLKGLLLA
jgi:hypothetical protein